MFINLKIIFFLIVGNTKILNKFTVKHGITNLGNLFLQNNRIFLGFLSNIFFNPYPDVIKKKVTPIYAKLPIISCIVF